MSEVNHTVEQKETLRHTDKKSKQLVVLAGTPSLRTLIVL